MVKREELLAVLERNNENELVWFVKQCKVDGAHCLGEALESCSKIQLDQVWTTTYDIVSGTLHQARLQTEDGDDQLAAMDSHTTEVTRCLVAMVTAMMSHKTVYIPMSMYETVCLMQDLVYHVTDEKLKNTVARMFEDWWKKGLYRRESLIVPSFMYILVRSLDLKPKPLVLDLKRVWGLHEVVSLINLQDQSSDDFKCLLQRCFTAPQYLLKDEGLRFLSLVLSLDADFMLTLHKTIKNDLLSVPRSWHVRYGEIYFRTWQRLSGQPGLLTFEESCIQDLMYRCIHAQPTIFPALNKLLDYIHSQKKHRGVDEMLLRLYGPFLWRSLRVANSTVRANAAKQFFSVFPLQDPTMNVKDCESLLQKQFDLLQELLYDPFPNVRSLAVFGTFEIMKDFWEIIPSAVLKDLMLKLVQDLRTDASSADVRENVIRGLTSLLDNHLCHLFLKPVLPTIQQSFHDTSEKVRIVMMELLLKVKAIRAIKYWSIVPLEHLLARLVVDNDPVNRRIVKLLFGTFIPLASTREDQLDRCLTLIQTNPAAMRQMFRYASKHIDLSDTVAYIILLCKAILMTIKKGAEQGETDDGDDDDVENKTVDATTPLAAVDGDDALKITNTPVMLGLCEVICVLWESNHLQLQKDCNAELKKSLDKRFSYALPEMIKTFTDPKIINVLLQISALLPSGFIPTISRTWVPKLRNMDPNSSEDDYSELLKTACKGGRANEIFELVTDWLQAAFHDEPEPEIRRKVCSGKKQVGFVDPRVPQPGLALQYLTYLIGEPACSELVLTKHRDLCLQTQQLLKGCLGKLQKAVSESGNTDEEFLMSSITLYCKMSILLHSKEEDCMQEMMGLLGWCDKHVVPVLGIKQEMGDDVAGNRPLALTLVQLVFSTFSNMLMVGIGNVAMCTQLIDTCTGCLPSDPDMVLLPFIIQCLSQVTEFLQFTPVADIGSHSNVIPNALSQILLNMAGYVRQNPQHSTKLLGSVRGYMEDVLKAVFQTVSLEESVIYDVMGTIIAAMLAELKFCSSQYELEEDASIVTLPPLTGLLVNILQKKDCFKRYFVDELMELLDCCESDSMWDLNSVHGLVHFVCSLIKCSQTWQSLKDLWNIVYRQTDGCMQGLSQEDRETHRDAVTSIQSKMKECETKLLV